MWSVCQVGSNSRECCKSDTGIEVSLVGEGWDSYAMQACVTVGHDSRALVLLGATTCVLRPA